MTPEQIRAVALEAAESAVRSAPIPLDAHLDMTQDDIDAFRDELRNMAGNIAGKAGEAVTSRG